VCRTDASKALSTLKERWRKTAQALFWTELIENHREPSVSPLLLDKQIGVTSGSGPLAH